MGYLIEEDLCTVTTKETVQKHRAVPASSGRTCVVVDCELANCLSDLWAIAYLLSAPNVDLRYVLATGGDTRAKLRVISKFLAHCGRADIEVGAGPTGASEPWLEAGDDGVLRPCSQYHSKCGPNPLLRDWAKKFDDRQQLARGGYPAYDPIVRLRDALDSRVDDTEAVVLCLGSLENLERLLDLDEDVFARRGGARVAAVRALDEPGNRAKRVLSAASSGLVARRGACAAALGPSLEDGSARDPFLCADSQAALALAQAQLAAGRALGGNDALRGFLESSIYAFAACPPPGAAPEVALDVREVAVDVVDGVLEDVDDERRDLLYVDVVEDWADAADALLVRDVVVKTVADGPWCPQGAHKAKEHKQQHRHRPRSGGPRRAPEEDGEGANAAPANYGAVVITHRHGYKPPGPRSAMSTRRGAGSGGATKPRRPATLDL